MPLVECVVTFYDLRGMLSVGERTVKLPLLAINPQTHRCHDL